MTQSPPSHTFLTPKGAVVPLGVLLRLHGVAGRNNLISYKCELYGLGAADWAHKKSSDGLSYLCVGSAQNSQWLKLPYQNVKALSAPLQRARHIVVDFDVVLENQLGPQKEIGLERENFAPLSADSGDIYLCDLQGARVQNADGVQVGTVQTSYAVSPQLPDSSHNLRIQSANNVFEVPLAWVDIKRSRIVSFGQGHSTLCIPDVEQWVKELSATGAPDDADE